LMTIYLTRRLSAELSPVPPCLWPLTLDTGCGLLPKKTDCSWRRRVSVSSYSMRLSFIAWDSEHSRLHFAHTHTHTHTTDINISLHLRMRTLV